MLERKVLKKYRECMAGGWTKLVRCNELRWAISSVFDQLSCCEKASINVCVCVYAPTSTEVLGISNFKKDFLVQTYKAFVSKNTTGDMIV